jgi:hypothetical protein
LIFFLFSLHLAWSARENIPPAIRMNGVPHPLLLREWCLRILEAIIRVLLFHEAFSQNAPPKKIQWSMP